MHISDARRFDRLAHAAAADAKRLAQRVQAAAMVPVAISWVIVALLSGAAPRQPGTGVA